MIIGTFTSDLFDVTHFGHDVFVYVDLDYQFWCSLTTKISVAVISGIKRRKPTNRMNNVLSNHRPPPPYNPLFVCTTTVTSFCPVSTTIIRVAAILTTVLLSAAECWQCWEILILKYLHNMGWKMTSWQIKEDKKWQIKMLRGGHRVLSEDIRKLIF